jgi:hypothetical protein
MTQDEGYKILIDSLLQTENTRGAYFLNKANELAIDPFNFFTDLKGLYDEINKYVNTKIHDTWGGDELGNREDLYNTINIMHLTKGSHFGLTLTNENIFQFLPGLEQFGQIIMKDLKNKEKDKNNELLKLLKIDTESKKEVAKTTLTGFQSSLTDKQIEKLYSLMQGNYFDGNPANFKAIFKDEPLPPDFSIKWNDSLILLAYFLGKNEKIKDRKKWKKISQIFGTKENLQQNITNNPYPKGFENIDQIWKTI